MVTPRSRGALSGFCLLLLGAWGALIPFIGPYFDYAYTPNTEWTWTAARFWLQVLPGGVTFLAGLVLLFTAQRVIGILAAWIAIAAGAWFVIGPLVAPLWQADYLGTPVGGKTAASVEAIGMFYGLGAAIILFGALAAGRFSVVSVRDVGIATATTREAAALETDEPVAAREPVATREPAATREPVATGEPVATREPVARDTGEPVVARDADVEPASQTQDGTHRRRRLSFH
jgi:hypothetical protein